MAFGIKTRVLKHLSFVSRTAMRGRDIRIPVIEGQGGINTHEYEPYVDAMFAAVIALRQGGFVDVGANLGQTLVKVMTNDPGRRLISFEASPFCINYVARLISENDFDSCTLVPLALSNERRRMEFQFGSPADPQATLIANFWTAKHRKPFSSAVLVDRGDAILEAMQFGEVGIIKVDVEGGELEVFQGLSETILRDRPLIIAEVLPYVPEDSFPDEGSRQAMRQRRERAAALTVLMRELQYTCYRIHPAGKLEETWDFGMDRYDDSMSNYFFGPSEGADALVAIEARYGSELGSRAPAQAA